VIRRSRLPAIALSAVLLAGAPSRGAEPDDPDRPSGPAPAETEAPPAERPGPPIPDGPGTPGTPAAGARELAMAKVQKGQELAANKRRAEAIVLFREALVAYPAYPLAHHELGVALAESGDLTNAEANLRRALVLAPDFARAQQALAEVLRRQKRHDEALSLYTSALRANPNDLAAWYGLAASLAATRHPAESLWALQRMLAATPNHDAPLLAEAQELVDAQLDDGVRPKPWPGIDKSEVAQANPDLLPRHPGDEDVERQAYVAALAAYTTQAKTPEGGKDAVLAYKIGAVYAIMNETRLAITWWRKALSLDPSREIVGRHLALLVARQRAAELASGAVTSGDTIERARQALLAGDPATALWLVKGSDAPQAAVLEGEARLQLGDFTGARAIFEALLAKDAEDRVARGGLAEALLRGPTSPRNTDLAQKTLQAWLGDEEAKLDTFLVLRRAELDARVLMPEPPDDEE